jgi:phage baseplate assembly protein V
MSQMLVSRTRSTDKRFFGVYEALVTSVDDPEHEGRVKLRMPWFDDHTETDWCRVRQFYAGNGYGAVWVPDVGDEVLISFIQGDMRQPVILGGLYNGNDKPPAQDPRERIICSHNGHKIRFIDSTPNSGDMGALIVEDAHGNRITLSNGKVSIRSIALLELQGAIVTVNGRVVQPGPNPI